MLNCSPIMTDLMNSTRYFVCLTLTLGSTLFLQAQDKPQTADELLSGVRTDFSDVPEGWLVGLDRAKVEATKANKDLLLNFSASDWIPQSITWEENVFTKQDFIDAALKDFVLVRLDFPRKRNIQSDALRETNEKAAAYYEIRKYPMVVLADSDGRPYATIDWAPGHTSEVFLKMVTEKRGSRVSRDNALAAAAKVEGAAKVPHLAKALEGQSPNQVLRYYKKEFHEIVALDPEKAGGLGHVVYYEKTVGMRKRLDALAKESKWEEAMAELDRFVETEAKTKEQKQKVRFWKLQGLLQLKRLDDVMPFLDSIIEMGPETPVGKKAAELKPQLMEGIAKEMQKQNLEAKKKADESKKK